MFTGALALDLLLGDVHSLKEKRSVVRPVVAELRRTRGQRRRGGSSGPAPAGADRGGGGGGRRLALPVVLDACERLVAARPELEVLSAHQQLFGEED